LCGKTSKRNYILTNKKVDFEEGNRKNEIWESKSRTRGKGVEGLQFTKGGKGISYSLRIRGLVGGGESRHAYRNVKAKPERGQIMGGGWVLTEGIGDGHGNMGLWINAGQGDAKTLGGGGEVNKQKKGEG